MVIETKEIKVVSLYCEVDKTIKLNETNINNDYMAGEVFKREIGRKDREFFAVLCLDSKGFPNHFNIAHIGTLNETLIHPREVFKVAIISNASSIIIGHNHPSGQLAPSEQDISITSQLVNVGSILGIPVLDHIIVNSKDSLSLRSQISHIFKEDK